MTIAFVFPGQGSQHSGMGRDLYENFTAARRVFEEADDALGFSLSKLCFEGSEADLQLTENTQPAILTVSIAALRAAQDEGLPTARYVAGHSLGEYSALVAAGALSFTDAVRTVRRRGKYMQDAVPAGTGAMAAMIGADLSLVTEVCDEAAQGEVCSPANVNSPKQIVIAGHTAAIERAVEIGKRRGIKRAIKLNVSAPFHCQLMQSAADKLASDLAEIEFRDLQATLITNVDAKPIVSGMEARDSLVRQVASPVLWRQTVEELVTNGRVETFVEIGAGKILSGLVRQTSAESRCLNIEDAASLRQTIETVAHAE